MPKKRVEHKQIVLRNKLQPTLFQSRDEDSLRWWVEKYFEKEVTTSITTQSVQRRDLTSFLKFYEAETKGDFHKDWTPRLSKTFQDWLRNEYELKNTEAHRRYSDRTINRILAHLRTFAKWVHKLFPFPLGDPMAKLSLLAVGNGLEIERALTPQERRRMLDAADQLLMIGGKSKDRHRFRGADRPTRKGYRPYRNRAIIYTLIETGMRRAAITRLEIGSIDWKQKTLTVVEKGGHTHRYHISTEGLNAIHDYVNDEREEDQAHQNSPALFLPSASSAKGKDRLTPMTVNNIWNEVAKLAQVEDRTPHSARHAMGKHIIQKTGNIAAVQRQLGHKNVAYSVQYSRITGAELGEILDERD